MNHVTESDLMVYLSQASPLQHATLVSFFGCPSLWASILSLTNLSDIRMSSQAIFLYTREESYSQTSLWLAIALAPEVPRAETVDGLSTRYAAPEVLLIEPRNTESDIWGSGVVFLEMLIVLK